MISVFYISLFIVHFSTTIITASGQGRQIDVKVLKGGDGGGCALMEERQRALDEIHQTVKSLFDNYTCNGTPGWRRVAFVNMTDTNYNCPTGLKLTSYSKRTCGRAHTRAEGCSSTTFSVGGLSYSRVCGRIKGYQFGDTGAFYPSNQSLAIRSNISSYYVEGVSLTHGETNDRQHIWTFASGRTEAPSIDDQTTSCPCDTDIYNDIPSFVANDYFCESGLSSPWNISLHISLFSTDPLWDGEDCIANSSCCQFNNPPWFTKNLSNPTTDDIELRICTYLEPVFQGFPLELIELYVQ